MLAASTPMLRAAGEEMDEERCAVGRGTESEAGAAGARAGAGVGLGEPRPRTGEAETAEEAQDAMGDCGGDAWWKSVNALCAEKLGERTYDTVMP
jgi:hypothetical protein